MEMLTSAKAEYLLQASLEVLHEQSLEWLNEMNFVKEEMTFLNRLLNRDAGHQFPTEECAALEKELTIFNSDIVDVLYRKIQEHERWLTDIIRTDTLDRQYFYREVHRELMHEISECMEKYFFIKRRIFSFAKK
jgi:hypothetical protein